MLPYAREAETIRVVLKKANPSNQTYRPNEFQHCTVILNLEVEHGAWVYTFSTSLGTVRKIIVNSWNNGYQHINKIVKIFRDAEYCYQQQRCKNYIRDY